MQKVIFSSRLAPNNTQRPQGDATCNMFHAAEVDYKDHRSSHGLMAFGNQDNNSLSPTPSAIFGRASDVAFINI